MTVRVETLLTGVRCGGISLDNQQNVVFVEFTQGTAERLERGERTAMVTNLRSGYASGIIIDPMGNTWVPDNKTDTLKRIGGDGTTEVVTGQTPRALFMDENQVLYYATVSQIFRLDPMGRSDLILGSDRRGITLDESPFKTQLNYPDGICVDGSGNVYVSDSCNKRVLMVRNGVVSTLCHSLNWPFGIVRLPDGDLLMAESDAHCIHRISLDGNTTVVAGTRGRSGFKDGPGSEALFDDPRSMCLDRDGNVYIADYKNKSIRKLIFPSKWSVGNKALLRMLTCQGNTTDSPKR